MLPTSQGGSGIGVIDFSKPTSISIYDETKYPTVQMTAPSNGVVWVETSSNLIHPDNGDVNVTKPTYTYCSISEYGWVSRGNDTALLIVNKGATITLWYYGDYSPLTTASATFYPFK